EKNITVEIPEAGGTCILADMEWTMEAVMNLLKNCMEHTPSGGTVRCIYEKNPLYTLIRIQDTGPGFAKEDLPRLFERFYRGKDAAGGGIGIGLALSKAIIEGQNGILSAYNLQTDVQKGVRTGGACFEIRFYR
ncbi:MAG: sensor histidine kinase, partial [Lachnospiraceae bacterium]|nr:sensor histidine kinase [Lachnospiraceae bacterium]